VNENPRSLTLSNARTHPAEMNDPGRSPLESEDEAKRPGMNLNDILFILFRHKWKIIIFATAGILGAAGIYFLFPSQYESQAKLLVRYVMDRSAVDGMDSENKTLGSPSEGVINSEVEILTSTDIALQVVQAIGAQKLLPQSGGKGTNADAARAILKGLEVLPVKASNIISVTYRNKDPKLAMQVLQEIVTRYFDKHLEVHRSAGAFDYVTKQADQVRTQLTQTEDELKQLKARAGVTSLAEDTAALAAGLAKSQEELDEANGELAAQQARVKEVERLLAGADTKQADKGSSLPSPKIVEDYQALFGRMAQLRQVEMELLAKYTSENRIVKVRRAQIDALEKQRRDMEEKYPGLIATAPGGVASQSQRPDLVSESARLIEIETKANTLKSRLNGLQERAKLLAELGPQIASLERRQAVEETNYRYFEASLEKARIDETLDPSRMPNISVVQSPSLAQKATRDVKKFVIGLGVGGLAFGIAIALLIELVLDRTVKRSLDLETRLRIPLLLSIPNFAHAGHLRLQDAGSDSEVGIEHGDGSGVDTGELLRPFCEAIRDRLGLYFEMNRMAHKPKLVAVTGVSKSAGASTLAAGLAATLSDNGDGKVLLFDKPVSPKRFYSLLSEFKSSDLDYVIFDMPSLGDTSATLPMASFMDKVLLVVEAEKSNQESIKRAYSQLSAKVDVSVIFNKSRSYGPKWLEGEL
jgi:polysaccharide biosynthesis transport protein